MTDPTSGDALAPLADPARPAPVAALDDVAFDDVAFDDVAFDDVAFDAVDAMTAEELDALPYGIIQLDAGGRILKYNAVESRLAALPREQAIGRQFFTEIAPCTKVQGFYGRFREGVIRESLDATFEYHFAFKQRPRDVTVRLFYSRRTRTVWVLISDRALVRVL